MVGAGLGRVIWVARAEEEAGRMHTREELGRDFRTGPGLLSAGTDWRRSRHDGLVKYLTPEAR